MRAVVRWLTLLIGVAIVAAMAWYGARALFLNEDPTRVIRSVKPDPEPDARDCDAATENAARSAERRLVREYVQGEADVAWLSGSGTGNTDSLDRIIESQASMFDYTVLPVEGEGWFVMLMLVPGATAPELPTCVGDVPVVVTYGGPFVAN